MIRATFLFRLAFFYLQSQMIMVGNALQVFCFCPIADIGIDVPPITFQMIVPSGNVKCKFLLFYLYNSLICCIFAPK